MSRPHDTVSIPMFFEACFVECLTHGIDVCELPDHERTAVLVAALDAEPDGEEEVRRASREMLHSIAVAGGWDYLLMEME
jgi:hypothetical protein